MERLYSVHVLQQTSPAESDQHVPCNVDLYLKVCLVLGGTMYKVSIVFACNIAFCYELMFHTSCTLAVFSLKQGGHGKETR